MGHSIRTRLTLWLAGLISVCVAAFALALYVTVGGVLTSNLDQSLHAQARQVAGSYDFGGPETAGDSAAQHVDIGSLDQFATSSISIETFDTRGHPLAKSSNLGRRQVPLELPAWSLIRAAPHVWTAAMHGDTLRVYSLPAMRAGHLLGLVVVAAPLRGITTTTHSLLVLLLGGGIVTVVLAVLGSGLLIRRGLRILAEMATLTESIHANRLDRRLDLRNPPREVARLAGTFNGMLDRLHESFAAQRRFVADASHELRTPLAIIRGRSEVLLLKPSLDDETRDGLKLVRDEAARMGRMVANLLLLARGDAARTIDRRPVDLDVLLLEVARHLRDLAPSARITIGREDRARVLGDADLLMQVLLNLVDNAVAHTPPGGRIDLSLAVADGMARLTVRDSGPGIAPEEIARIFERFYRVGRARARGSGGAGLGLAIARWIAEAHGGHIVVESRVGHGSIFTVVLPISDRPLTVP